MDVKERDLIVRRFRLMVGTEFSGQEKDERFIESALLWKENRDEMQKISSVIECSCGDGLNLRDFYFSEKQITFVYKCDFCFEYKLFKYERGD